MKDVHRTAEGSFITLSIRETSGDLNTYKGRILQSRKTDIEESTEVKAFLKCSKVVCYMNGHKPGY